MYQTKDNAKQNSPNLRKPIAVMLSIAVLILGLVGGTLAYFFTHTNNLTNNFAYARVTCQVEEQFDGTAKSNVTIKNTGDIPAYIRAAVIVTWKDAEGNVYGQLPVLGTDYNITYGSAWAQNGDYFYCTAPVNAGASTPVLIETCTEISANRPAGGYTLSVEIIADAVQSQPSNAVVEAWGDTPAGN